MRYIPALDDGRPQVSPSDLWQARKATGKALRARIRKARTNKSRWREQALAAREKEQGNV